MAFATSGAVVAMEEEYDLLGVVFLGLAIHLGWPQQGWAIAGLGTLIVALRLASFHGRWTLPYRRNDTVHTR